MSHDNNGNSNDEWTEDTVRTVLINPIHTMGSSPTISGEMWIETQRKLIDDVGLAKYLPQLLSVLQQTFGRFVD